MSYTMMPGEGQQTGKEACFIGGKPVLPRREAIPHCSLCGAEQTFFLQVAFPSCHVWSGLTMAVFSCTSCADEKHLIPEMLSGELSGANIPENFLTEYQKNFHFMVFETAEGQLVEHYQERVRFFPILLSRLNATPRIGHVGGRPDWVLEDESPSTYSSSVPMYFLLQIDSNLRFETLQGTASQIEIGLAGNPEFSPDDFYQIFIGNTIYFFGTDARIPPLVYALTQVD